MMLFGNQPVQTLHVSVGPLQFIPWTRRAYVGQQCSAFLLKPSCFSFFLLGSTFVVLPEIGDEK